MSSNLSRRSFLKGAAALAVVSAASGVLAGCSATGVGGTVSGTGAARSFKDGENVITVTNTAFDIVSIPGSSTTTVIPSFTVQNGTAATLSFKGSEGDVDSTGYTIVATATFDGKLPAATPQPLPNYEIPSTGSSGSSGTVVFTSTNFNMTSVDKEKTVKGVLVYEAPFKNWDKMVLTMTLYKKPEGSAAQKVASTTFTFNQ